MRITAVIPCYNRAELLPRALQSVIEQSSPVDEIIVVDDGSSDDSAKIAQQYPQVKLLQQPNKGVSAARNIGIRAASFEWIALLDSDDSWQPRKIERIRAAQQRNPGIGLLHSDEFWIRNGVRVNPMHKHRKQGGDIFSHCLALCVISPSAAVIEKDLLQQTGLFDESLPACEDYDLWLRLCHNHPVHYIDEPLITKYGGHEDQLSRKYWGMDRFRIMALHHLLESADLAPGQQAEAHAMLLKKLDILLKGARKHANHALLKQFEPLLEHYSTAAIIGAQRAC